MAARALGGRPVDPRWTVADDEAPDGVAVDLPAWVSTR